MLKLSEFYEYFGVISLMSCIILDVDLRTATPDIYAATANRLNTWQVTTTFSIRFLWYNQAQK